MNCLRFSGSLPLETCSADTVVPRMTSRSRPAATARPWWLLVRCGDRAPATVTPAARISLIRAVIRSSRTGAL